MAGATFDNRLTRLLGVALPIVNAPMGNVVTPALVAAVAGAGGIGMVPGSLGSVKAGAFIDEVRELTDAPLGLNIPVAFTEPAVIDMVVEQGVRFVTTSTGPVSPHMRRLQDAGVVVFHVVTSLETALEAVAAGVDGLVVESGEGAGLRAAGDVSMMVLLPLIASRVDLPIIAAGGIADGASMAAAFALGAHGVQMGTRMLATEESAVHADLKRAVVAASEADTILINRHHRRPLRVLRTATTEPFADPGSEDAFKALLPGVSRLYSEGDLSSGFASLGQVSGRVDEILPVSEVLARTVSEFRAVAGRLAHEMGGAAG